MHTTNSFSPQPLPKLSLLLRSLLVVLAVAGPAAAQEFRGSIAGTVNDSSGAAVPGATVTATNQATNTPQTTTTNEEGAYTLLYLTPGTYTLLVEATGFKKHLSQGVE